MKKIFKLIIAMLCVCMVISSSACSKTKTLGEITSKLIAGRYKVDFYKIQNFGDRNQDFIPNATYKDFVINFEDLGVGTEDADLVFDALYEHEGGFGNIYTGHKFYILKDEFYFQPTKIVNPEVNDVLLTFGGTDPNNFTEKVLEAVLDSGYAGRIDVILGFGYPRKKEIIEKYESNNNIQIYTNVKNISDFMLRADIIFTSAGRTMYEVCSVGTPCICLCQNGREQTHLFGSHVNGFINMGLGENISHEEIKNQFKIVWQDYDLRLNMSNLMKNIDLKHGFENIWSIVEERYWTREFEQKH